MHSVCAHAAPVLHDDRGGQLTKWRLGACRQSVTKQQAGQYVQTLCQPQQQAAWQWNCCNLNRAFPPRTCQCIVHSVWLSCFSCMLASLYSVGQQSEHAMTRGGVWLAGLEGTCKTRLGSHV